MSRFRHWVSEIHRRSLWQVLGVYAAAGWIAYEVVLSLTEGFGLPLWFPPFAVALLVVGLPVVLATACVKEPASAFFPSRETEPGDERVMPAPQRAASRRLLTWRNTLFSVGGLFAVWGLVAAGWLLVSSGPRAGDPVADDVPRRIVVLPFENLGAAEDEYFADGVTEELTSRLASVQRLAVVSRTSAVQYKGTGKTLRQIGEELGVDYVLEGTVRWAHTRDGTGQVRITPQLIRVSDDTHVWADSYDRELAEIFVVQSEIARRVIDALQVALGDQEGQILDERPTHSPAAYDFYLRGIEYRRRSYDSENFQTAKGMYEKAIEADSTFVLAWARLAELHVDLRWFGYDRSNDRLTAAEAALTRAEELAPGNPWVQLARGTVRYRGYLDYDGALDALRSARRQLPRNSEVLALTGYVLRRQGDIAGAEESLEAALRVDPRNADVLFNLAETKLLARKYNAAASLLRRVTELQPDHRDAHVALARLFLRQLGMPDSARAQLVIASRLRTGGEYDPIYGWVQVALYQRDYGRALELLEASSSAAYFMQFYFTPRELLLGEVLLLLGDTVEARKHFTGARNLLANESGPVTHDSRYLSALGRALAGLGRNAEAIAAGEKATEVMPISREAWRGAWALEELARIYASTGELDEAVTVLERLLEIPSEVERPVLRLDPAWDALRDHPRFQRLVGES